ncbi:hypothetical protein [Nocardioides sp.]|uniref:hypothetical protein n=1 Tax=Nocardioides sp. TaxID=35761 RepID=UPI00351431F2
MRGRRATGALRWSRALVLAGVVLTAGALAHRTAGGALPGAFEIASVGLVCVVACAALLGVQRTGGGVVALTVGGQLAVHTAMGTLAGHGPAGHAGHALSASVPPMSSSMPAMPSGAAPAWWTHGPGEFLERPGMAVAHLVAAVAVGCWLAVGEQALWSLLSIAGSQVQRLTAAALLGLGAAGAIAVPVRRPRPADTALRPLPQRPIWSRGPVRRGPPVVLLTR